MMIVVGVFGGFNVQSELRILGAPRAAPGGGAVCTGRILFIKVETKLGTKIAAGGWGVVCRGERNCLMFGTWKVLEEHSQSIGPNSPWPVFRICQNI